MPDRRPIANRYAFGDPSETNMPAELNRILNTRIISTCSFIPFDYLYILEYCKDSGMSSLLGF